MRKLIILSMATGYGGAERSIELVLRHAPAESVLRIYAESEFHLEQLARPGALPAGARLVRVTSTRGVWGRRRAALHLAIDCLRHPESMLLINTHASALVAAMAAKFVPGLGARSHLYVRDFGWRDLDFILARLAGARVLVPSSAVLERRGYLAPFHVQPSGPAACSVLPDMAEIPTGPVGYDGPVLHLATVNYFKGHVDLMLSLQWLKRQGRSVAAHSYGVVGEVALNTHLRRFIEQLGIADCYRLGAYMADPQPLLRACRAVVVPSVSHSGGPESFGRAVIEAWAWRKPVVAYACGAVAGLIEDGVDGLLVPEGDVEALAEALHRLYASPALCRRLGEAGHAKVVRDYEAGAVTRRLLGVLAAD